MDFATNHALIDKSTNVVTNIIWGMFYGDFESDTELAVPIQSLPVKIGDAYTDGKFYHDGVEVTNDYAERMADMQAALGVLGVSE